MKENYTVLIVDDEPINLKILTKALEQEYFVLTAQNGKEALDIIENSKFKISAIILDLIMPVMNGYEFLEIYSTDSKLREIPVLVSSGEKEIGSETKCLELGANDFISKPYNISVIKLRLLNAIERSQLILLKELKYAVDFDALTDIYNKDKLFREVKGFLTKHSNKKFVFMVYDVDNFKVYNSFFGVEEGDKLIQAMANHIKYLMREIPNSLYSRNGADTFNIVVEYNSEIISKIIHECVKFLMEYKPEYRIKPTFGIYIIDDINTGVAIMNDRAKLASRKCKGKFTQYSSYYDETLSAEIERSQLLINRVETAMEKEEFVVYYQPKYDIRTSKPESTEALCRWIDPVEGIIPPNSFIPIFEKNGLISKLDYYMWEHVCIHLRNLMDKGIKPLPVSVNISRVNIYNPKLVEVFCELLNKYDIPRELFNIELTESAYTETPEIMARVMSEFRVNGFITMMDDFGSGYSSLNVLKNIPVDKLKIDMKFMEASDYAGRGECIVASVIRMAKWLNMTVVVEGIETESQVNFLRGIGCEYIQGYYFAKPMPFDEYVKLITTGDVDKKYLGVENDLHTKIANEKNINFSEIISNSQHATALFSVNINKKEVKLISGNENYYDIFGFKFIKEGMIELSKFIDINAENKLFETISEAIKNKNSAEYEYRQVDIHNNNIWIYLIVNYMCDVDNRSVVLINFENITQQKELKKMFS